MLPLPRSVYHALLILAVLCSPALPRGQATAQDQSVISEGVELRLLSEGFKFTEGPIADPDGNVFFTDQPNDAIHCWTVDGKLTTFLKPAGRSNGLFFDLDGKLLACADEQNQLWSIDAKGQPSVVLGLVDGKKLNGPNDLWVHSSGAIYFTDPFYKRPYWNRGGIEQPGQAVYRISPDRGTVQRLTDDLRQPNGIIGDSARGILYVADIGAGKTYRYEIATDGLLQNKQLFCNAGSDGMTIDRDGSVYLTGKEGVSRYSADGVLGETIAVPKAWTANVTFGGADRSELFITAGDSLYSIKTTVQGL